VHVLHGVHIAGTVTFLHDADLSEKLRLARKNFNFTRRKLRERRDHRAETCSTAPTRLFYPFLLFLFFSLFFFRHPSDRRIFAAPRDIRSSRGNRPTDRRGGRGRGRGRGENGEEKKDVGKSLSFVFLGFLSDLRPRYSLYPSSFAIVPFPAPTRQGAAAKRRKKKEDAMRHAMFSSGETRRRGGRGFHFVRKELSNFNVSPRARVADRGWTGGCAIRVKASSEMFAVIATQKTDVKAKTGHRAYFSFTIESVT